MKISNGEVHIVEKFWQYFKERIRKLPPDERYTPIQIMGISANAMIDFEKEEVMTPEEEYSQ